MEWNIWQLWISLAPIIVPNHRVIKGLISVGLPQRPCQKPKPHHSTTSPTQVHPPHAMGQGSGCEVGRRHAHSPRFSPYGPQAKPRGREGWGDGWNPKPRHSQAPTPMLGHGMEEGNNSQPNLNRGSCRGWRMIILRLVCGPSKGGLEL